MNIVFDARWIYESFSGVPVYSLQLIRFIPRMDSENQYTLLFDKEDLMERTDQQTGFSKLHNVRSVRIPYGIFSPTNQWRLPSLLKKCKVDLFHSPNYMIPLAAFPKNRGGKTRCITSIHDLIPMVLKDHAPRALKSRFFPLYKTLMHEIGARSDGIITMSENSKKDILHHLALNNSEKIRVIYNGSPDIQKLRENKAGSQKNILFVGRMDPYKNLQVLIDAFGDLQNENYDCQLTIIAQRDDRYPEIEQQITTASYRDKINWRQNIDNGILQKTYQLADVLVLPSRYEGFGLPVLEAMACGTPVICSNTSSLPEIAGDAALMFDPDDLETLKKHLREVLANPNLAESMREKGWEQCRKFMWEKTAQQTVEFYHSVLS